MKLPAQIYDASDNPDGGIYLRVAYDPDFLVEFKGAVPSNFQWWVSDKYAKRAIRIASCYFNLEYCDD